MKNKKAKYIIDHNGNKAVLVDEKEYRKRLLAEARFKGCEIEMLQIFNKYDTLLRNCGNMQEAKAIGAMGVMEVSNLLDGKDVGKGGSLIIDGKVAIENKE